MSVPAIRAEKLTRIYGTPDSPSGVRKALDAFSLEIPQGEFFALLGPNGAGKSTFINILSGLVRKSSGRASVMGHDIETSFRMARRLLGVVPQELNIDPFFTPAQTLEFQSGLYGVPRRERQCDILLERLGLADIRSAYARTLSGGMRRRLLIAKALVHSPPVLILDEPTAGVDVDLRHELWALLQEINADGVTILLTTHYIEEAERLCNQIGIIASGVLCALDSTTAMLGRIEQKELIFVVDGTWPDVQGLSALAPFQPRQGQPGELVLTCHKRRDRVDDVIARVQAANIAFSDLRIREAALEDVFLQLVREKKENDRM